MKCNVCELFIALQEVIQKVCRMILSLEILTNIPLLLLAMQGQSDEDI